MKTEDDPWKRLIDATKTAPVEEDEKPASEVSVTNLRESVRSLFLAITWSRWSLLAAALAGLIFLLVYLTREPPEPRQPIIPTESPATPETP